MNENILPQIESSEDVPYDLMRLLNQSSHISTHLELFLWLNGEVQLFLPHDAFIVAWGGFAENHISFDIVSAIPGLRTQRVFPGHLLPFLRDLYTGWKERRGTPYVISVADGFTMTADSVDSILARVVSNMRTAMVHGMRDVRANHDYLYIALSGDKCGDAQYALAALRTIVPHLDSALRRMNHVQVAGDPVVVRTLAARVEAVSPANEFGISGREMDIMTWVREGKTNDEIGQILGISVFTVKNHLQRIFKKLNVHNRAQAVAKIAHVPGRGRVQ